MLCVPKDHYNGQTAWTSTNIHVNETLNTVSVFELRLLRRSGNHEQNRYATQKFPAQGVDPHAIMMLHLGLEWRAVLWCAHNGLAHAISGKEPSGSDAESNSVRILVIMATKMHICDSHQSQLHRLFFFFALAHRCFGQTTYLNTHQGPLIYMYAHNTLIKVFRSCQLCAPEQQRHACL